MAILGNKANIMVEVTNTGDGKTVLARVIIREADVEKNL